MSDLSPDDAPEDTKTITLRTAIKWRGGDVTQISLREPKAGEVRKAEGQMRNNLSNEGVRLYNTHLISMVSGLDVPVVEALPVREFNEAAAFLARFIDAGQATGST